MLYPMQIPDVSFSKSFRGFDVQEVSDYVQSVALFEEEMNRQQAVLSEKVQVLEQEVNRLREVESSLFRAMKLAEEAQKTWQEKVEKEAKQVIEKAQKQAESIVKSAENEVQKAKLFVEHERKQILGQVEQEVKDQTRELTRLKQIQAEIAGQLTNFAQQTLASVDSWSKPVETPPGKPEAVKQVAKKVVTKKVEPAKKVVTQSKPDKLVKKTTEKKGKHLDPSTIEDDGLPTLNKVLEAYAKTSGPRGKVGEIN